MTTTLNISNKPNYLVNQNFEGAGFDNGETWLAYAGDTGAANPDYATNPLLGSQSLHIKDDDSEGTYAVTKFSDDTGYNALYGFFRFKILDYPSATYEIMQTYNAGGDINDPDWTEVHEMLWISNAGVLQIRESGGDNHNGSTALALNTPYCIWWHITRSAGRLSTGWVKLATDLNYPIANEIEWTDWDLSDQIYRGTNVLGYTSYHGAGYEYVVDQVIVCTEPVMTFPLTGILDNFNRSNEGPPPSSNWDIVQHGHVVSSNQANATETDDILSVWTAATYDNPEAYLTVAGADTASVYSFYLLRGYATVAAQDGYEAWFDLRTGYKVLHMCRVDNQEETQLDDLVDISDIATGDKVGCRLLNNVLSAWWQPAGGNWTLLAVRTDNTYTGQPYYIIPETWSTVSPFDDFGGGEVPA